MLQLGTAGCNNHATAAWSTLGISSTAEYGPGYDQDEPDGEVKRGDGVYDDAAHG
jgi:hypothetical protein